MEIEDDAEALTLRHGRVALRLMFSTAQVLNKGVCYWFLPLFDGVPMFSDHMFRRLDHEIAAGQPAGSIFSLDSECELVGRLSDVLSGGGVSVWHSNLPEVTGLFVADDGLFPNLSQRRKIPAGCFDINFAFHVAKPGEERWNCQDAGPGVRLTVPRPMLERFRDALAAGIRERVPRDPYDVLFEKWEREQEGE